MKDPIVFDLDAELNRLNAKTYSPLAAPEEIAELEAALGHEIDPIYRECLVRFGRIVIYTPLRSLTNPEWATSDLTIGQANDTLFWAEELPDTYDLHGYTAIGADHTGMPVIYGPFPDPRVYVFDRFDGSQNRLELIGDNIENTIQRLLYTPITAR